MPSCEPCLQQYAGGAGAGVPLSVGGEKAEVSAGDRGTRVGQVLASAPVEDTNIHGARPVREVLVVVGSPNCLGVIGRVTVKIIVGRVIGK